MAKKSFIGDVAMPYLGSRVGQSFAGPLGSQVGYQGGIVAGNAWNKNKISAGTYLDDVKHIGGKNSKGDPVNLFTFNPVIRTRDTAKSYALGNKGKIEGTEGDVIGMDTLAEITTGLSGGSELSGVLKSNMSNDSGLKVGYLGKVDGIDLFHKGKGTFDYGRMKDLDLNNLANMFKVKE